jgi:hypothetical protein
MFVRDSCSKQLDSDRLAAYVPNVADYKDKDLQAAFASALVTTSVLLELIANRKTVLGSHHRAAFAGGAG